MLFSMLPYQFLLVQALLAKSHHLYSYILSLCGGLILNNNYCAINYIVASYKRQNVAYCVMNIFNW